MEMEDLNRAQRMVIVNAGAQSDVLGKENAHLDDEMEMESNTNMRTKEIGNSGI